MTVKIVYSYDMNYQSIHFLLNVLAPSQLGGGIASLFLLVVSFVAVHAVKLANRGYSSYKNDDKQEKKNEPMQDNNTNPMPASEPIYYLVEKKRVKKKPVEYEKPKRVRIEKED